MEQQSSKIPARDARRSSRVLFILFFVSLPLLNPWVRGDGVGYYAFARAPLIEHNLDFSHDYQAANPSFREARLDENGRPLAFFRTRTGHLDNHFTVGPAILWSPFLLLAHAGVLIARAFGSAVPADGFSAPYRIAMAFATGLYGFIGLLLSFRLARHYVEERWALLSTIAIWWASSLPVYMYFNPSWSHAHSAFAVALFLFYWHKTRSSRAVGQWRQWLVLGLCAGLMMNVYYPNTLILAVLLVEAVPQYLAALRSRERGGHSVTQLLLRHFLFFAVIFASLVPTLIARQIVSGSPFDTGYISLKDWLWRSPVFLSVLFSSNHGLFVWTPLLLLSIIGLVVFAFRRPAAGRPLLVAALCFYFFIACYPDWAGISSFGNRFFVSLTSLFVIGLAVFLSAISGFFRSRRVATATASIVLAYFILWNFGLMFQWGSHLIPARGPVSLSEMVYNQFFVVPGQFSARLKEYFFKRRALMQQIEQRDIEQLKNAPPEN